MSSRFYDVLPVFAQDLACSLAGFLRAKRRFTPIFHRTLREWERKLHGPLEELHAIQALRLARLLDHARTHVPHYRHCPDMVRHSDPREALVRTLAQIQPSDKKTYRENPGRFYSDSFPRHRLVRGRTSGTTGSALPLRYTRASLAEEYATVWRMRRQCGVSIRDPHLTFTGQIIVPFDTTRPPFWRRDYALRQTLFSAYHMKPENLGAYVDAIHESNACYAQGYPSALHLVSRAMLERGRPLPEGNIKAVFTSSESLLSFQKSVIEEAFSAPVFDRYGSSEFAVSMTSCDHGRLHVDMEYGIVEVEPREETAEVVHGPLLVTGLSNCAMPFIRYRIGDIATRLKRPCSCGRPGDVLLDIDGRIEDYVLTPDGRMVGRLDHIFKDQRGIAEAQILQHDRHAIEVLVIPDPSFEESSKKTLLDKVRERLGREMDVRITLVSTIEREANGKLRAVKSSVGRLSA